MSWVKLDDGFADHPKIIRLTPHARDLFIWGLCYCARQLTDGFIPKRSVSGCGTVPRTETRAKSIAALVREGLWVEVEGGWQVHDYLDYNPNRAKVLTRRAAAAERLRRFRERQAEGGNGVTEGVSDDGRNATPGPGPVSFVSPKAVAVGVEEQPRPEDEELQPLDDERQAELERLKAETLKGLPF